MADRVSVLLPTYNEAGNIGRLVREILRVVPDPVEILVVDDDSPDDTAGEVEALARRDDRVRLLRRTGERGLASAIRDGLAAVRGEVVVWMDCDFSHPPELIPRMLEGIASGYDAVVASRYVPGGSDRRAQRLHRWLSRGITTFASLALGRSFKDYTSGFIAVRRSVLDTVRIGGDYGEYFIALMHRLLRNGCRVLEIPYANVSREVGESKTATSAFGFLARGRRYVSTILSLALERGRA